MRFIIGLLGLVAAGCVADGATATDLSEPAPKGASRSIRPNYATRWDEPQQLGGVGQRLREAYHRTHSGRSAGLEHCFFIVRLQDGSVKAGEVTSGGSGACSGNNLSWPTNVTAIIGGGHTHPDRSPPSGSDIRRVALYGLIEHIVRPDGTVMRLAPTAGTYQWAARNPARLQGLDTEINEYFQRQRSYYSNPYGPAATNAAYDKTHEHVLHLLRTMGIVYSEYHL